MTKPGNSKTRERIDSGAMRDKVDMFDPAAAPMDTDNEASGHPTPEPVAEAADRQQEAAAQRAVPRLDESREESARRDLERRETDWDADDELSARRRPETWRTPPRR